MLSDQSKTTVEALVFYMLDDMVSSETTKPEPVKEMWNNMIDLCDEVDVDFIEIFQERIAKTRGPSAERFLNFIGVQTSS